MKDARLYVRATQEEIAQWKAKGADEGMLLSEWIRECCNSMLDGAEPRRAVITSDYTLARAEMPIATTKLRGSKCRNNAQASPVTGEESSSQFSSAKTGGCKHGRPKGDHCWQCGGMAVIE